MTMKSTDNKKSIILASKSPRRKRLLEQAGIKFSIIHSRVDEEKIHARTPKLCAMALAEAKAGAVAQKHPDAWVIGADSIVVIENMILNKPVSREHAAEMLKSLSGKTHQVITGYSIMHNKKNLKKTEACSTEVSFKELSSSEINWYLKTPEPWDKAGAYAIQGIAAFMIKSINGSYTNVVGLPVCEVVEYLTRQGVIDRDTEKINASRSFSGI
jgi:septum formation protein